MLRIDYWRKGQHVSRIIPNDGTQAGVLRGINRGFKPVDTVGMSAIETVSKHVPNVPRVS